MRLSRRRLMRASAVGIASLAASAWVPSLAESASGERGGSPDRAPSDVAWSWFEQLYDIVKAEATSPPAASRVYGIAAVALYESIVEGTRRHRSLAGQLNGLVTVPEPRDDSIHSGDPAHRPSRRQ